MKALSATRRHDVEWPELTPFDRATPALVQETARTIGPRVAVIESTSSLTWQQVSDEVDATASLLTTYGIGRGDVVCVQLPNWWETFIAALAVWRLGAVLNPVTPIYRASELRAIFQLAQPSLVLVPGAFGDIDYVSMATQALTESGSDARVAAVRSSADSRGLLAAGEVRAAALPNIPDLSADDICLLMFTSGTTGRPKGVMHSHRTLQYEAWSIAHRFTLIGPTVFMPSPLTHITGLLYGILLPILTDGAVVLQDRWNAERAVDLIEAYGCTFCVGATPFLAGLVKVYGQRNIRSALTAFVCGGADVPPVVIQQAQECMGTLAVRAYGLTELPTLTCGSPGDSLALRSGDDGALTGGSQFRLVDSQGRVGDLEARGPEMFLGYLDHEDNALAFTNDGWFRTGDRAVLDGDRARIVGRSKDIIVRGGENLSPQEVENLVVTMPGVSDIAVVGVPDPELGERACAMLVPNGQPPTMSQIRDFLDANGLARQKAPEHLLLCDTLPRTPSGKVQKYLLREQAARRLASGEGETR